MQILRILPDLARQYIIIIIITTTTTTTDNNNTIYHKLFCFRHCRMVDTNPTRPTAAERPVCIVLRAVHIVVVS